ncbi:MAG: hypothetical protein K2O54_02835, partial [Prevotella sp.]|nr:hypothetical protein [Prevotella sp.]
MAKYATEIRKTFNTDYIKVVLADNNDLEEIKKRLELVQSVHKVNISNNHRDLTVYIKPPFSAGEAEIHVKAALSVAYEQSGISSSTLDDVIVIRDSLPAESKARKCYDDALNKMIEAKYDRNCLDDIRLSLELYLKEVLGNDKPLEKQTASLKEFYNKRNVSSELIETHTSSLHNLCHFFNNHTK